MPVINVYGVNTLSMALDELLEPPDIFHRGVGLKRRHAEKDMHWWPQLNNLYHSLVYALNSIGQLRLARRDIQVCYFEEFPAGGKQEHETGCVTIVVEGLVVPGNNPTKMRRHIAAKLVKVTSKHFPRVDCVVKRVDPDDGYVSSREPVDKTPSGDE